jgi:rRNA-processing protein FCF1
MTQKIIVDSCGWVAIIDSGINFELELERMFGNYELILLDSVLIELEALEIERPRRKSLLLELLKQKSVSMDSFENSHTDDYIFELSIQHSYAVLTIDKALKKRLYQSGRSVVEVAKNNHLRLIEGL